MANLTPAERLFVGILLGGIAVGAVSGIMVNPQFGFAFALSSLVGALISVVILTLLKVV